MSTYELGVDIGGTFTDMVLLGDEGSIYETKISSSPPNFGNAVIRGLEELLANAHAKPQQLSVVMHGTTVATNAILEGRGATVALLTTRGFRDVLELGRMRHPYLYDLFWQKPEPLVPRRLRLEVDERINSRGEVERRVDREKVADLVRGAVAQGVQSFAICLINSFLNADHEKVVAEVTHSVSPDAYVSASYEILPEIKEFERTSTTVVNAYIRPIVDRYVHDLASHLAELGVNGPLLIMQSSGGLLPADAARFRPVQTVESGPAAGVTAAKALALSIGEGNMIAFDMGGTTAKVSLIEDGEFFEASEYEVGGGMNVRRGLMKGGGYTIRVPSIDLSEVGAGGGSIFWIDNGGAPHVGPQSAGAIPGPACYGLGGNLPTLTDANVVLGYLNPVALAGGHQSIEADRAHVVIRDHVAKPMGLDVLDAAYGMYTIAISNMAKAVKAISSERGRDPRDFVLVAFGGAGPAYAVEMAREFEMPTVLIPRNSGLFSTVGLLVAPIQHHEIWSYRWRHDIHLQEINEAFATMETRLVHRFHEGHTGGQLQLARFMDIRYVRQSFELMIPVPLGHLDAAVFANVRARFDAEHERTYGHQNPEQKVEIVNLRLRGQSNANRRSRMFKVHSGQSAGRLRHQESKRDAYFGSSFGLVATPILTRHQLTSEVWPGPLIIEDMDATTVVPPECSAHTDSLGNIVVEVH